MMVPDPPLLFVVRAIAEVRLRPACIMYTVLSAIQSSTIVDDIRREYLGTCSFEALKDTYIDHQAH